MLSNINKTSNEKVYCFSFHELCFEGSFVIKYGKILSAYIIVVSLQDFNVYLGQTDVMRVYNMNFKFKFFLQIFD